MASTNGNIYLKWPQMGAVAFLFPANPDLANIMGRTDSDFENSDLFRFCGISAQHCTSMTNWPNTIQCLGSDDIMSLGIKFFATEGVSTKNCSGNSRWISGFAMDSWIHDGFFVSRFTMDSWIHDITICLDQAPWLIFVCLLILPNVSKR